MQQTVVLGKGSPFPFMLISLLVLALLLAVYLQIASFQTATDPLVEQLALSTGIDAPLPVFQEAIRLAAKDLATELGIDLENYDITQAEYEALVQAAAEKFGFCEQYRLIARTSGSFPCYSCKAPIFLQIDQTFKIGQTCLEEKGRYPGELPAPNLAYQKEFTGSIFEVLVAEYVKLLLFRYSNERKSILDANNLLEWELPIPPGNKILK